MQQSVAAILSITDIFDNLSPTQLELVAAITEPHTCQQGDIIIHEHDNSNALYIIVRGVVEILMTPGFVAANAEDELELLTELRQGQVVGEVALVDEGMRTATVRAGTADTQLLRIPRHKLIQLCDVYPDLGYKLMRNIAADLAFKIRNTDLTVRQYQLLLLQTAPKE